MNRTHRCSSNINNPPSTMLQYSYFIGIEIAWAKKQPASLSFLRLQTTMGSHLENIFLRAFIIIRYSWAHTIHKWTNNSYTILWLCLNMPENYFHTHCLNRAQKKFLFLYRNISTDTHKDINLLLCSELFEFAYANYWTIRMNANFSSISSTEQRRER